MLSSERESTRWTLVDSRMQMPRFPQPDFSSLFVSALSLAMTACIVPTTHAQVDRAGLNGTVTETSGKALSGCRSRHCRRLPVFIARRRRCQRDARDEVRTL